MQVIIICIITIDNHLWCISNIELCMMIMTMSVVSMMMIMMMMMMMMMIVDDDGDYIGDDEQ